MLLDTCALLWLVQGGGQLSRETLERINQEPVVYVSAITGFEVGMKYAKGRLDLPATPADWFSVVLAHHDLKVLQLDLNICLQSTQLPAVHNDPCDRLIIATALVYNLSIVTTDPVFAKYGIKALS